MRIRSFFFLASLCALARPGAVAAQHIPSPYRYTETSQELSVFGGTIRPGTGIYGFGPGPGPVMGVRYGIEVSGPISLEGQLGYIPTTRDVVNPDRPEGNRAIAQADQRLLTADVRLNFSLTGRRTWHRLNPFLLAGGGLVVDLSGAQPEDAALLEADRFQMGTKVEGAAGGGLRLFLTDRWTVRGDAVLNLWKLTTPDGWGTRGFTGVPRKEWVSGPLLTFGLGYRF